MSLKLKITDYIKSKRGQYVYAWDIERFGQANQADAYTARRRTQELTERGHKSFNPHIEKSKDEKGNIRYRWIEEKVDKKFDFIVWLNEGCEPKKKEIAGLF